MLIKELSYTENACDIFQHLLSQKSPIILDSMGMGRYDIISANPRLTLAQTDWATLKQTLEHYPSNDSALPFTGGILGYIGYDCGMSNKPITKTIVDDLNLANNSIGLYDWAIIIDHEQKLTHYIHAFDDADHWQWLCEQLKQPAPTLHFHTTSLLTTCQDKQQYVSAFEKIKRYIHAGDCYQANLTQRFSAKFEGDAFAAYQLLRQQNPGPFGGFMRLENQDILSFSPERFIQINDKRVETKPIKGTRPRDSNSEKDHALAEELKRSEKDRAENLMIVDLMRNDLSRTCQPGSVQVPKLFELESYRSVHHLVSTVTAQLDDQHTALDCLHQAFPGGSITGTPKIRAMQIIEELEQHRRHVYCGSLLHADGNGSLDSSIAIRTVVAHNNTLYCWAGGAIVADSEADSEYQESLDKISRIKSTLDNTLSAWQQRLDNTQVPSHLRDWLSQPKILSAALTKHCNNPVMRCLSQQFDAINSDEQQRLGSSSRYLVRQIAFFDADNHALTYARTVIPHETYEAHEDIFDNLHEKPIGVNFLHNNPDVTRSSFEYATLNSADYPLCPFNKSATLFARRSTFTIKGWPLLITEFFSPQLPPYQPKHLHKDRL